MHRRPRALAVIAFAFTTANCSLATAGDLVGFRSPSGNIHCMYDAGDRPASLRCDIRDIDAPPRRPASCDADWGRSFVITGELDRGALICSGDAIFSDDFPVLEYGDTWQSDGFTCLSEESGVSCFNAHRHGFKLSRASRELF